MRYLRVAAPALCVLALAFPARADDESPLGRAKELFRRGVNLFEAGDVEAALEQFTRSRAAYPSTKNTLDVAVCLDRLGRYDEALDLYEQLTASPPDPIEPSDRVAIERAMAILRTRVGAIVLTAATAGSVLLDGRLRGELHGDKTRLFALPGPHVIRVVRDGYLSFERNVEVTVGQEVTVAATLARMREAGQLRVENVEAGGADVYVDGVRVGPAPWEGTLGPGAHLVWTRKGEKGSSPKVATVFEGETTLVRTESATLGATVHLDVEPDNATLAIDGTPLGATPWEGRLPLGTHKVVAQAGGYKPMTILLVVGDRPGKSTLRLEIDPNDARWPKRAVSTISVGGFGGYALATTAGQDYAGLGGVRGVLSFRGFALEAEMGYLTFQTVNGLFGLGLGGEGHSRSYGPTLGGGVRYRFAIGSTFGFLMRLAGGALFYSSSTIANNVETAQGGATGGYVRGELAADLRFGPWTFGANFGFMFAFAATVGGFLIPQGSVEYQF